MVIDKVVIENFKGFKDRFTLSLNKGLNIVVGDNEAGKSTILEAINIALTGLYNGRYLQYELSQYLFNNEAVEEYLNSLTTDNPLPPPSILIELYLEGEERPFLKGTKNTDGADCSGVFLKVEFDDSYQPVYEELIKSGDLKTLPIEYYRIVWKGFSRDPITARNIPLKSAFIDSSSTKFSNGSDVYISRIVKELLTPEEIVNISRSHREMKEHFMDNKSIQAINDKLTTASKVSEKTVSISVELSSKHAWESSLTTYLEDIPFHYIGKGEQSIIKTNLALAHNKAQEANIILLEEPENHLSHSKLNELIKSVKASCTEKQILVTTHSSFVANKLGLDCLTLLNDRKPVKMDGLSPDTKKFFEKIQGYDTLRLILCDKAILVEGDSDELVIQKAYMTANGGKLPIEDRIDVISVGVSFLRFLEIAVKLSQRVCVVTDNDGDIEALEKKYSDYLGDNAKANITIHYDSDIDIGELKIGDRKFNYNTLEPKFLKANGFKNTKKILGVEYDEIDDLHKYMKSNKTECALKIFDSTENIIYPDYITEAISDDQ
ncbi:ATP-dependent nuclease [Oceanobacter antarcticus]|uniref:AAA family ATPase n=1 Tax=Oceanobacter antarcticus TaxID=3133425 RepID=A0ABW8NDZ1_9GAMM